MGRTLHININKILSDEEKEIIEDFNEKMNTGIFKNFWSCENLWLDTNGSYNFIKTCDSDLDTYFAIVAIFN